MLGGWAGGSLRRSVALVAVVAAVGPFAGSLAGASVVSSSSSVGPSATGPATGPIVPPSAFPGGLAGVPTTITDGHPATALLTQALALDSVGTSVSPLLAVINAAQARLDQDMVVARQARAVAAAADRRAQAAEAQVAVAARDYQRLSAALRRAAIEVYMHGAGPTGGALRLHSAQQLIDAQAYEESTLSPAGVLAKRRLDSAAKRAGLAAAHADQVSADSAAARAAAAMTNQTAQLQQLRAELTTVDAAQASAVLADHATLAQQAGAELTSPTALEFTPAAPLPAPVSTTSVALTWAFSELGKPYLWGGTGPNSFDCSGLTQYVWAQAGVAIPRVAAAQYAWTIPVPLSQLLPGDLVFFGRTDIHHVGMYIGDGLMINAPHTGTVVQISPMWWSDLTGFGRVHTAGVPVPNRAVPSVSAPAPIVVNPAAGAVPSQTKPPASGPGAGALGSTVPAGSSTKTPASTTRPSGATTTTRPAVSTHPTTSTPSTTVQHPTTPTTIPLLGGL
ncbi:MAG: C40 family peptidase [Acidimicrobiales bacterium]